MDNLKKLKIGVVAGGFSSEREISLKSGGAVHESLIKNGFSAKLIDIKSYWQLESLETYEGLDLVFIMIHGKGGEDGFIQEFLDFEIGNIKYTGSNDAASIRAFDKEISKGVFKNNGLEVPLHKINPRRLLKERAELDISVFYPDLERNDYDNFLSQHNRLVVKPSREGSSYGVSIVNRLGESWDSEDGSYHPDLEEAVLKAESYDGAVMVEEFIEGRELTVAIVGENTYPPIEIISPNEFYDFSAKYDGIGTKYIPANLPSAETKKLSELCLKAFKSLGCSGWGRVDLIKSKDNGNYYILEVNTVPGMTETSLVPKAAKLAGYSFNDLLVEIIKASID
jgi:D-alanine-D-alanine ligase